MEDEDLIRWIKWLYDPNGGKIKLSVLSDDIFINLPENKELQNRFKLSKYSDHEWKWHQLVRAVLEIDPETKQYMYDRLLSLVLDLRQSHEEYFEIKNEEGIFRVPNSLAELNRLDLLYNRYFTIYKKIVDQIHFDYPHLEHYGPNIRGKINWTRTFTKSSLPFPLAFSTEIRKREFDTSENILLVLCAEWMHRESNRLLHIQFEDPLTESKKNLLRYIVKQTSSILQQFPISSVLNSSRRYLNLSYNDVRIKSLEYETTNRLNQGLVRNLSYWLLLEWIQDFRGLDMENIAESTPSRHIIEPLMNIDTIYEIWIFMEFIGFIAKKDLLVSFQLKPNPNCKFRCGDYIVTLWYEKIFTVADKSWIMTQKPDFTAMIGNEIIAIFDAKNYSKSSKLISDSKIKMLAYMINLDANFGALIYPYYPKIWEEFDMSGRINKLIPFVYDQNRMLEGYEITKIAKSLSKLSWDQLPKKYQDIFPHIIEKYQHPSPGKKARYHHDQTLCLIRMYPNKSEEAIAMKEKSLNLIFEEIISRIPVSIKS